MLEQLKKKSIKKSLLHVIFLLALGILLIVMEFANIKALLHGKVKFETLLPEEISDDLIVDAAIDLNFGCYMEEYEENTDTHYTRTTDLYYIILTGDENAEDYRYMGIKVPASDGNIMDAMAEASYNYTYSDPVSYTGAIKKMPSEDYRYFKEFFISSGWTEEEIEAYTLPYYINVGALTDGAADTAYFMIGLGIVMTLAGIFILIWAVFGGTLKTFKKELADTGFSEMNVNYEFEDTASFNKGDIRVGKRLTFFMTGFKPHVILNDKLVWAYEKTTTHRRYGIKVRTTYEVAINTYDKRGFHISVANEQAVQEILQYINQRMSWVVIGYSDELNKMFKKDYQGFLNLRYNSREREGFQEQTFEGIVEDSRNL